MLFPQPMGDYTMKNNLAYAVPMLAAALTFAGCP